MTKDNLLKLAETQGLKLSKKLKVTDIQKAIRDHLAELNVKATTEAPAKETVKETFKEARKEISKVEGSFRGFHPITGEPV